MSANNLAPFMLCPRDQRRPSFSPSQREGLDLPKLLVKQEKVFPPIIRNNELQNEQNKGHEANLKVTTLGGRRNRGKGMPANLTLNLDAVTTRRNPFVASPSPLLSPNFKAKMLRRASVSNLVHKTQPFTPKEGKITATNHADALSSSDGAKQIVAERKRLKMMQTNLLRKLSMHSIENGLGATPVYDQTIIHRGSDVTTPSETTFRAYQDLGRNSKDFVTSPRIGSTMRLREQRSQAPSTSTSYSESPGPTERFLPLRRRKSSHALLSIESEYDMVVQLSDSGRRRSSVTSLTSMSYPDVWRDSRSRANAVQEPRFFRFKQPTSRRTSSTSDDVMEGKSRESFSKEDNFHHVSDTTATKLSSFGQAQRRMKVGILSQQFIREMRRRNKPRRTKRSSPTEPPIEKFRKVARSVKLLLRCLTDYRTIATVSKGREMPFSMFSHGITNARSYPGGLKFDPAEYRATNERQVTPELRRIMTLAPSLRTEKELKFALKSLRVLAEAFGEFPIRMQESLVKVTWLDEFEAKRVIIRQGQPAENFYFIVAGSALVSKNRIDPKTGELFVQTVAILRRGMSFGELAIMRRELRSANVVSNSALALLTVPREDFIDIFMHRMDGEEPEFISFLRKRPEFAMFPLQQIPRNKPQICAFTFFRVGAIICDESSVNDVIVVVKSGFCKVLKAMKPLHESMEPSKKIYKFKSSLMTGRKKINGDFGNHHRKVVNDYSYWMISHPLSLDTLKFLADDTEAIKREGRRRPSLIEVEHDIDHVKLAKELENSNTAVEAVQRNPVQKDLVYIHVQTLTEGDVFGLAPLLFDPSEGGVSMSLISEGAECILINKNFYLKNVDAEIRERLMRTVQPYPTVDTLAESMRQKNEWEVFKQKTMKEYLRNRKACNSLKCNGSQRHR